MIRTPKFPKIRSPHDFGYLVGLTDRAYAKFGTTCCLEATRGRYAYVVAEELMLQFNGARKDASGSIVQPLTPHKVQISKLNRIWLAGGRFGIRAEKMLLWTSHLHLNELSSLTYIANDNRPGTLRYNGEYNTLVEVSRIAVRENKILNSNQITAALIY